MGENSGIGSMAVPLRGQTVLFDTPVIPTETNPYQPPPQIALAAALFDSVGRPLLPLPALDAPAVPLEQPTPFLTQSNAFPFPVGGNLPFSETPKRTPRKKRARILREGQLTMIIYGANEALTWARRIAQFQHAMRNVLGDRRRKFMWSGSVVDSVVGAFLTQNVSDMLSSRAYMEVASRWPAHGSTCGTQQHQSTDTVDWEAVRTAPQEELSDTIKCRGMQTVLASNIQACLNRVRQVNMQRASPSWAHLGGGVTDDVMALMDCMLTTVEQAEVCLPLPSSLTPIRESLVDDEMEIVEICEPVPRVSAAAAALPQPRRPIELEYEGENTSREAVSAAAAKDLESLRSQLAASAASELLSLEWLRRVPDEEARDFLMGINGLGRKSSACIMLLTLAKKEFPVDTNVGRICSRLGWIPLDAAEAIEDLDGYAPEPEVHAYLRSRLLGFDIETLYELHYQMITLGKIFCSKANPNCTACPMRSTCEYALHDGPSLHGRKRVKVAHKETIAPEEMWTAPPAYQGNPGDVPRDKRVHWKTQAKIEKMAREQEERERRFSSLTLDELIAARSTRPRTKGLRHPPAESPIAAATPLQRVHAELRAQAAAAQLRPAPQVRWLPIDRLHLELNPPSSVWDPTSEHSVPMEASPPVVEETGAAWMSSLAEEAAGVLGQLASRTDATSRADAGSEVPPPSISQPLMQAADLGPAASESVWDIEDWASQQSAFAGFYPAPPYVVPVVLVSKPAAEPTAAPPLAVSPFEVPISPAVTAASGYPMTPGPTSFLSAAAPSSPKEVFTPPTAAATLTLSSPETASPAQEETPLAASICFAPEAFVPALAVDPSIAAAFLAKSLELPLLGSLAPSKDALTTVISIGDSLKECVLLHALGVEMAGVSEAMAKLPADSEDVSLQTRLLELSLQALHVDTTLEVQSTASVMATARSNYRLMARMLHPDKCKHDGAADAFAALSLAMATLVEYGGGPAGGGNDAEGGAAGFAANFIAPENVKPAEERVGWNPNRLVVAAHILPAHLRRKYPYLCPPAVSGEGPEEEDHLMFLPLANIPTFQREYVAGRDMPGATVETVKAAALGQAPAAVGGGSAVIDFGVATGVGGSASDGETAISAGISLADDRLEGILLVSTRAALRGRFPLNGTYFQINEVFADQASITCPVKLSRVAVDGCKTCAIYFGLAIHYLSKGMNQEDVALMFTDGRVCFRAFDPVSRAPVMLPHFLMPSIPTATKSTWKNAAERKAKKVAKAATQALKFGTQMFEWAGASLAAPVLANNTPAAATAALPSAARLRMVRVPLASERIFTPPTVCVEGFPIGGLSLETSSSIQSVFGLSLAAAWPGVAALQGMSMIGPGGIAAPLSWPQMPQGPGGIAAAAPWTQQTTPQVPNSIAAWPHLSQLPQFIGQRAQLLAAQPMTPQRGPAKKNIKKARAGVVAEGLVPLGGYGKPKSQEAADAKSGRGQQRRRFLGPRITADQRCGACKACLNPQWKKACELRRAELQRLALQQGASVQHGEMPVEAATP